MTNIFEDEICGGMRPSIHSFTSKIRCSYSYFKTHHSQNYNRESYWSFYSSAKSNICNLNPEKSNRIWPPSQATNA